MSKKKEQDKQITLEERFLNIEDILKKMEENEVSLDESFELYKEGLAEVKAANAMLDAVEKEMLVMNTAGELETF